MFSRNIYCVLVLFLLLKLIYCDDVESIEVKLNQGVLLGRLQSTFFNEETYISFKSVPYAEPPIGGLRFLPPKPHKGWEGTYQAYEDAPTCKQFSARMRNNEPYGVSGSEDCLYLSIFTPRLKGNHPVIVFDFNDNFVTGFNGTKTYSPDFFIEEDVIIVTINHRLGVFGYLTTEDGVIPGNVGIRDFILGLQWVKENIDKFGGDPNKVTLMGSRGGAATANILLYSKQAKGLFSAVVMQSGTAFEPIYFPNNTRTNAFQLAQKFDINTDDSEILLKELQKVDDEELLFKAITLFDAKNLENTQMNILTFTPCVEKDGKNAILPSLPENGQIVNDVPIVIGFNSREGLDLAAHFIHEPKIFNEIAHDIAMHFPIRPGFRFDSSSKIYKEANREIYDFYYGEDVVVDAHKILDYAVYIGDALRHYAVDFAAKKLSNEVESPVYYYMFDFKGSLNENFQHLVRNSLFTLEHWGATFADELCYLHLCSRIRNNYKELKGLVSEQPEVKVLKKMVRMWTNFAKTRNPTPEAEDDILKNLIWKPIDKRSADGERNYLHINKKPQMKINPLGKRAEFWDNFLVKYAKMAIDGVVRDEGHDEL